jgi:hypothetical protein
MTRSPKTVPPNCDNPLPRPAVDDAREPVQESAADLEQQSKIAIEAWKMGRKLRTPKRGLRPARIPRMHPGSWRSGR